MVRLLIADSDLHYAKKIISNIVKKDPRIRLIDIGTSTKETINIINNYAPNIAVVNIDVIDISKINTLKYIPHLILITSNLNKADSTNYILKSGGIKFIRKNLNDIINSNDFSKTKEKLIGILGKLKFDFCKVGTRFLIECIMYCYENIDLNVYENLENKVYPFIAKNHNTAIVNVRHTIVSAVNDMYRRNCIDNTLYNIFDYFYLDDKLRPTPKLVIITILRTLCNK